MDTSITQETLEQILNQVVLEVTEPATGVTLYPGGETLSDDLCTVHTSFQKGCLTGLTLYADTALLVRMARHALKAESPTPQDLEDCGTEYFNILCGKIAAALFRNTRVSSRFSIPEFYHRRYTPEHHRTQFMLTYVNEHQESAQLTHHVPQDWKDAAESIKTQKGTIVNG